MVRPVLSPERLSLDEREGKVAILVTGIRRLQQPWYAKMASAEGR
jgi:hypothetical protein